MLLEIRQLRRKYVSFAPQVGMCPPDGGGGWETDWVESSVMIMIQSHDEYDIG